MWVVQGQCEAQREDNDHQKQHGIFHPPQLPVSGKTVFLYGKGNLMEQLLKEAKGAQKAADGPAQQSAEENEKAQDIIREPELEPRQKALQASNGAGTHGAGTGIAVKPWDAYIFPGALINFSGKEAFQIGIVKEGGNRLNGKPSLIQFPHTPYKSAPLSSTPALAVQGQYRSQ